MVITSSFALEQGGLIAGIGSAAAATQLISGQTTYLNNVEILIKQTSGAALPIVFGNVKSKSDGGLAYLKNGALEIDSSLI